MTGDDRESFFQGQVTNDLSLLQINSGQITARLNRTGKVQSFLFIAKLEGFLLLLCPEELALSIRADLEKFIVMEDVVLESLSEELWLRFNSFLLPEVRCETFFDFIFYGLNARLVFEKHPTMAIADEFELEKIRIQNGWPKWNQDIDNSNFINDSYLNEIAISYKKGCFLGQETVAKIENNRGAAYYPVILKIDEKEELTSFLKKDFLISSAGEERKAGTLLYQAGSLLQALLFRDFRVVGRKLILKLGNKNITAVVSDLPYYKNTLRSEIALELYHLGVDVFQSSNLNMAMNYMKRALEFDPTLADAYETLGVMLGRVERYDEAINWMDKLLKINPGSVMAHTNKSLFLMKQGKIEEAEAEKSLATVKSFAVFGQEAQVKRLMAEEQKKKEEDTIRREKMFQQVLEIDESDTIALFGMADILFQRKEFNQAINNLVRVVSVDPGYSTAYLLLGKSYEALLDKQNAIKTYQSGIMVASKRGDLMPANEMQSRLNQLVVNSGLI